MNSPPFPVVSNFFQSWIRKNDLSNLFFLEGHSVAYSYRNSFHPRLDIFIDVDVTIGKTLAYSYLDELNNILAPILQEFGWLLLIYIQPKLTPISDDIQSRLDFISSWMKNYCNIHKSLCFRDSEEVLWFQKISRMPNWENENLLECMFCVEYSPDEKLGYEFGCDALDEFLDVHEIDNEIIVVDCVRYR